MILDRPLRAELAREIAASLAGARVQRAHQPDADTLILTLHGRGREQRLLACAHPRRPRVHLTAWRPVNPRVPSPFCMLVRKHLLGRPFAGARAEDGLPVITLRFGSRVGGAERGVLLAIEMTGHAATVVLLAETEGAPTILGLLRPLPAARRSLTSGAPYVLPILEGRLDPATADPEALVETMNRLLARTSRGRRAGPDRLLSRALEGVGRRLAAEAFARADVALDRVQDSAQGNAPADANAAISRRDAAAILGALRELLRTPCEPLLLADGEGQLVEILPFPMGGAREGAQPFTNISEALDLLCLGKSTQEALETTRRRMLRSLQALLTHRERSLARQREDLARAGEGQRWRAHADLLLAQGDVGRRGLPSLAVVDAFDDSAPVITIALDPALTLAENAGRLYKRAQKAKRGVTRLGQVIARGETELRYLGEQLLHAELAEDRETLDAIAASLGENVKLAPARGRERSRAPAPEAGGGPRRFALSGWELIVGRHGRDNDQIVTRIGNPRDLWFHARGMPGAHVLLRLPGKESPDAQVQEGAARVAAHFSRARDDARADVIVALLKHVRKPRGMPPGQVMVRESRTLRVAPGLPAELVPRSPKERPAPGRSTGRDRRHGKR